MLRVGILRWEGALATRLLIVDNSVNPAIYTPVQHWARFAGIPSHVLRPDSPLPGDLRAFSHAFVTGSEASITHEDSWIARQCEIVRMLAQLRIPTLASCFGHQMLAKALWGASFVRRSPTPEFGWVDVTLNRKGLADPLLEGVALTFQTYSAHFDEIAPLPPDFHVLGTSPRCPHAVVRVGDLPMWGLQHHPEIDIPQGKRLLEGILMMMPEKAETIRAATFPIPRDSEHVRQIVVNFLRIR